MRKLFDRDFFKLLIGFLVILIFSFGVLFFVNHVQEASGQASANTISATRYK